MVIVAADRQTAAPFALCPGHQLLAVGMAAPFALCPGHQLLAVGMAAQGRGDAEGRASRVDVLGLLRPSGEPSLGGPLQVDCGLKAPGLSRLAWSAALTGNEPDFAFPEQHLLQAGLLAGGFQDGTILIWNSVPALCWDLDEGVPEKPKAALRLDDNPETALTEKAAITTTISDMYAKIGETKWPRNDNNCTGFLEKDNWTDWYSVDRELDAFQMELVLTKCKILEGPVLGLCFNDLHPNWLGTAGLGESIYVHDISYPVQLCRSTCELNSFGSVKENTQLTCLKWNKIYPTSLAATSRKGTIKVWDLRTAKLITEFGDGEGKGKILSDLEFSWNNPMHLAVSTVNSGTLAAVTVWDMRWQHKPLHEFSTGTSGATSLSWNRSGQLLASHTDGTISCCDVYGKKMVQGLPSASHGDLGVTWIHSENTFATLSSKHGVMVHEIEWPEDLPVDL